MKARILASIVGVVGALVLGLGPASASAATIGQTTASANYFCTAEYDLQTGVSSGTGFVVPPGSWLLTSWSTFAGSYGGSMGLMIFRPAAVPGAYTVIAESPVQSLAPNGLNSFSASVVVQGGDLLGFWSGNAASCATFTELPEDVNPYGFGPEPQVGTTVFPAVAPGYLLNISATLSSPADLLTNLLADVTGQGPGTSLADKVTLVEGYVAANNKAAACSTLTDFISEVKAQDGKTLGAAQAASFTTQATNIEATLGC